LMMATIIRDADIEGLRATHFEQLQGYLERNEREGVYYGNKDQYIKRQEELKLWLNGVICMLRTPGVRTKV